MAFFISKNPDAKYEKVMRLAEYYISECNIEGINSDVAFIQMCLETGFLPNSINEPNFASPILKANEVYNSTTIYKFV